MTLDIVPIPLSTHKAIDSRVRISVTSKINAALLVMMVGSLPFLIEVRPALAQEPTHHFALIAVSPGLHAEIEGGVDEPDDELPIEEPFIEGAVEAPPALTEAPVAPPPPTAVTAPPAPLTAPQPTLTPTPTTAAPLRPAYGVSKYTVVAGDTMYSIARRAELSLPALSAANGIADASSVKVGQTLFIPSVAGAVHVCTVNDTVQSVADQYQSRIESIREANRLDGDAKLQVGQLLVIPGVMRANLNSIKPVPQSAAQLVLPSSSPIAAPKSAQPTSAPGSNNRVPLATQSGMLIWPLVGAISTDFSPSHRGLDIVASMGTPIKAALPGKVIGAAEGDGPYGWYVILLHGGEFTSVYAHLSKINVKVGDSVEQGQIIANVGSTGLSTGPHLHYEIRQSNVPIDPRPYLP